MKFSEALNIIKGAPTKPAGYMVSFERMEGSMLRSDHFPDKHAGETLIQDEEIAWEIAREFARATRGQTCNIYVVDDHFSPVLGYEKKLIQNR